jgi:hypothetical protein
MIKYFHINIYIYHQKQLFCSHLRQYISVLKIYSQLQNTDRSARFSENFFFVSACYQEIEFYQGSYEVLQNS